MKIIKVIATMLLFVTLFNFIGSNVAYATGAQGGSTDQKRHDQGLMSNSIPSNEIIASVGEGTVNSKNNGGSPVNLTPGTGGPSFMGGVISTLSMLINLVFTLQIEILLGSLTASKENGQTQFFFTIDRCVFNRIPLFNVNYFDIKSEENGQDLGKYQVGELDLDINKVNNEIKKSVANTYAITKLIALAIGLLTLIYVGIRMAISTIASDQAKYKKMLIAWVESVILLFFMVYIMTAIIMFADMLTGVFYDIRVDVLKTEQKGPGGTTKNEVDLECFENAVRMKQINGILEHNGMEAAEWSLMYWIMLFIEIRFAWLYVKRFLMVGFLIAISPLITITYSIDKAGDGKAQAFSTWMNEFILNVLIQPLHALIYLIMIITANSIAARSPIIAIALLISLGQAEKIVKIIFGMNKTITLRGVNALGSKEG